jgi:methylmalonyl-CoA decarboxylase
VLLNKNQEDEPMAATAPKLNVKDNPSLVKTAVENAIGTIILDSPHNHNALSGALIEDIKRVAAELKACGVRVVVLRAAPGAKVWSSGHDVRELPTNGRDPLTYNDPLRQLVRVVQETPVPVIAMIEGSVWGGACELVMSCDVVFAAEEATFAIIPARVGVPYDIAGVLNFMQRASLPIIKEMLFTARPMSAQRALQVGIVNQVFPAKLLESATYELATQITRNSPLVIALLKEELRVLSAATPLTPEGFERIQALRRQIYDSADYQEGIKAFFERRMPRFTGQ